MNKYKYLVFDATYYLRRNWSVISSQWTEEELKNPDKLKYKIIDSFLWTVLKVAKNYTADKIILAWDKRPYLKTEVINEYKKDRILVCEEEQKLSDKLQQLIDSGAPQEEIDKCQVELDKMKLDADRFRVYGSAKYEIVKNFENFGMVCINEPGYECDDLAYLISLLAIERKEKVGLVSKDSDWICMANEYTDIIRAGAKTGGDFYNFSTNPYKDKHEGLDAFHYYQINDIYNGGHNNVVLEEDFKKYTMEQICDKIVNKDMSDLPGFNAYFSAMSVENYMDGIKGRLLRALLSEGHWSKPDWLVYHDEHELEVYPYYYAKIMGMLNLNLYKD